MKKIVLIFVFIMLLASILLPEEARTQTPQKMSYQAVIRDADNQLVTEQNVGMQISILQGSTSGTSVYTETQTPTTNANGLVSIEIGEGTTTDDFSAIDWANGPYFIKTETDPTGGTNYTITGVSQLISVPFALHANTAETISGGITETDPVFSAWDKDYSDLTNKPDIPTNYWNLTGDHIFYNTGSVGIGVANLGYPYPKLEVGGVVTAKVHNGTDNAGGNFQAWTDGTAPGLKAVYSFYPTFDVVGDNGPRRAADIVAGYNAGAWGSEYLSFHVGCESRSINDNDSITDEIMRITADGNIGIGMEEPTAKLDVNGEINVNANFITNVANPSSAQDAATKNYVDSVEIALKSNVLELDNTTEFIPDADYEPATKKYVDDNSNAPTTYSVGDFAQGGVVFWVDETGQHGLICAIEDQDGGSGIQWYNGTYSSNEAHSNGVYAGKMNTMLIIANQGSDIMDYAAGVCALYKGVTMNSINYGDWYLPSKDELNLMFQNKATINTTATANGGSAFKSTYYWSSNETSTDQAWNQYFGSSGSVGLSDRSFAFYVRAIRAF